jgi:hypothetical protein
MGSPFDTECPKCGQRAPIVLRGLDSRCAACGAPRFLLGAPNVSFAGQPSRIGGTAATVAGVAALVLGLSGSAVAWAVLQGVLHVPEVAWAVGLSMATITLLVSSLLLFGGSRLRRRGAERQQQVQLQAVKSLVQHRRGAVTAEDVAEALELPPAQADALLTQLARETATDVTVDVDARGRVAYDFQGEERRWRVLEESAETEEHEPELAVQQRKRS